MAIVWRKNGVVTETTHVGQVVDFLSDWEKIMSDVWATRFTTVVVDENGQFSRVHCGWDECCDLVGTGYVDAPAAAVQAYQDGVRQAEEDARQERLRRAREETSRRKVFRLTPGDKAVVEKGRKVPLGTRGVITVVTSGAYGMRVCIRDDAGQEHWTSKDNIRPDLPMILPGGTLAPGATWTDAAAAMHDPICPLKGDKVRLRAAPSIKGTVFWVRDGRVGFKASPNAEPVWASTFDVEYDRAEVWTVEPSQVEGMPEPFCRIVTIRHEDGNVTGFDREKKKLFESPASELPGIIAAIGLQTPTSES